MQCVSTRITTGYSVKNWEEEIGAVTRLRSRNGIDRARLLAASANRFSQVITPGQSRHHRFSQVITPGQSRHHRFSQVITPGQSRHHRFSQVITPGQSRHHRFSQVITPGQSRHHRFSQVITPGQSRHHRHDSGRGWLFAHKSVITEV